MGAAGREAGHALVVDDDGAIGAVLVGLLEQGGIRALHVASAEAAQAAFARAPFEVVLTDLRMPGKDGIALLHELRAAHGEVPVIVITAHGSVERAVEAMKAGASDFLTKPFDRDQVLYTVKKALRKAEARADTVPEAAPTSGVVLGRSPAMVEVNRLIERAAKASSTVLLRGESGTGKEVAARAIHQLSARRDRPFIAVHCAALPEQLLESELFGYEKGAFTGATTSKPGRVELADGGTLFLDEIGDITPAVQVKLLRLLQEKSFQSLGGTRERHADLRFIAATHRDLEGMVEAGEFRQDLFYRLDVLPIWLPPLRERREDIPDLARTLLATLAPDNGSAAVSFAHAALIKLGEEAWPGNVRELSNFVERLVVFSDGERIEEADVLRELGRQRSRARTRASLDDQRLATARRAAEQEAVLEALQRAGGNRTKAARLLGVSRRTLYNHLLEIHDPDATA
jgi:DNA-binding NtrC family response regulator